MKTVKPDKYLFAQVAADNPELNNFGVLGKFFIKLAELHGIELPANSFMTNYFDLEYKDKSKFPANTNGLSYYGYTLKDLERFNTFGKMQPDAFMRHFKFSETVKLFGYAHPENPAHPNNLSDFARDYGLTFNFERRPHQKGATYEEDMLVSIEPKYTEVKNKNVEEKAVVEKPAHPDAGKIAIYKEKRSFVRENAGTAEMKMKDKYFLTLKFVDDEGNQHEFGRKIMCASSEAAEEKIKDLQGFFTTDKKGSGKAHHEKLFDDWHVSKSNRLGK